MGQIIPFCRPATPDDDWINATQDAAQRGKQVSDWLGCPETQRYIKAMADHLGLTTSLIRAFDEEVLIHPKLWIAFQRWLDPDFSDRCDELIAQMLTPNP